MAKIDYEDERNQWTIETDGCLSIIILFALVPVASIAGLIYWG